MHSRQLARSCGTLTCRSPSMALDRILNIVRISTDTGACAPASAPERSAEVVKNGLRKRLEAFRCAFGVNLYGTRIVAHPPGQLE
jgi:hypothetical protein